MDQRPSIPSRLSKPFRTNLSLELPAGIVAEDPVYFADKWIPRVSCRRMRRSGSRRANSSRRSIRRPGGSEEARERTIARHSWFTGTAASLMPFL
jgi:hypothetical protein